MNKIIDNKSNVLRICAGNDFSILVQITEYDTETGAWVNYDLSAVSDVHMCLIADNGKRINLPVTVNNDGTASAPIQAAYLQKTTYGVELTWLNENLNRRTYAPCLLQIVTTTAESTSNIAEYESNDAYHFNIKMEADVAILSIGKISDEYVTQDELQDELEHYINEDELGTVLENYVTNSSLSTTLEDYATKQYVDDELANIDLTDYYTKSEVDTTLNSYGTSLSSGVKIIPGPTVGMDISLNNSDAQSLSTLTIPSFQKNINSSSPKGWVISPDTSIGFVSKSTVETIYDTVDDVNGIMSDYITSTSLNSTLSDYATVSSLSDYVTTSFFATTLNDYVTNTSLNSTLSDYATKSFLATTLNDYVTNSALSSTLNDYATKSFLATTLNDYVTNSALSSTLNDYVTTSIFSSTLNNYATISSLSDYVTNSSLSTTLGNYVTNSSLSSTLANYASVSDVQSLDTRVTALENGGGGTVPSNVVTSDDGNEIVCLTQSEYDTLEQNQQLDPDVFYYITDTTSNYVTNSSLTTTLSNYATKNYVDTAVAGVTIDETNLVHKTGTETITGAKTFNSLATVFDGQCTFNYSSRSINYVDNLYGIGKTSMFGRGSFNQACIGQILAPNQNITNSTTKFDNQVNTILFQTVDGANSNINPTGLTTIAKIDSTGIYEGTTLLANKYVQSSNIRNMVQISQSDYDTLVNNSQVDANTLYVIV